MSKAVAGRQPDAPLALVPAANRAIDWDEARRFVATMIDPTLTPTQLDLLIHICRQHGWDPLTKPACFIRGQLCVTLVGLASSARRKGLDGLAVDAIHDGEQWIATATVWRKDAAHPFVMQAREREFRRKSPTWDTMPSTMTEVRALTRTLRLAFGIDFPSAEELGYDGEDPSGALTAALGASSPQHGAPAARTAPAPAVCLAFIADPAKAPDRKRNAARQLWPQAPDLPTLAAYRAGVAPHLHEDDWYPAWHDRFLALGGRDAAPVTAETDPFADDATFPSDADFAEGGAGEEPA